MIKPRQHQAEARHFHKTNGMLGTLLMHWMGLGKTLTCLWEAQELMSKLRAEGVSTPKFVVICPKSAVPTWRVECHKNTPNILRDMVIWPYSQLHTAIKSAKMVDVRMIIFDESHYLMNPSTERIKKLSELLKEIYKKTNFHQGRLMLGTGTPMPNSAAEFYTSWALCTSPDLLTAADRILDLKRYDNWKKSFTNRKDVNWVVGKKKPKAEQRRGHAVKFEGVANDDLLGQLLGPYIHYRRVEDCVDLPQSQDIMVDLELDDDKLLKDADLERPEAYMSLVERLARAKTPHMLEWVDEFLKTSDEQLIVFSLTRHPIDQLAEKHPSTVRLITGAETAAERATNLADFQQGKYRVLAMTYGAGSESLNLQNAHVALYQGYPWTDAKLKQAKARIDRSGQQSKTRHYFLVSGENDQHILGIVQRKGEATKTVENVLLNLVQDSAKHKAAMAEVEYGILTLDELI